MTIEFVKATEEEVRSGQYYVEARNWYNSIYMYVPTERTFLLVGISIIAIVLIIITVNIYGLFPIQNQVRYMVKVQDLGAHTAVVKNVGADTQRSIATIFLKQYVIHREEYEYGSLRNNLNFINGTSTQEETKKYYETLNPSNPNGYIVKYRTQSRKEIAVETIKFIDIKTASVTFKYAVRGGIVENGISVATIVFDMDSVDEAYEDARDHFKFIVTSYESKKINE